MTHLASSITVAILAGGEGRRVGGEDKGLLYVRDRALIEHVIDRVRLQAATVFICANRHADDYARFGRVIADAQPGFAGPLAGIACALAHCATPWLLTVPVDAPALPVDLAVRLHAAAVSADAGAATAHDGAYRQPLFALYRHELASSAVAALADGGAVYRWQVEIGAVSADFADCPLAFANLNCQDDIRQWERTHAW